MKKIVLVIVFCILNPFTSSSNELSWSDKCPYCRFSIPSDAIVCGHCGRDLSLWRQQQREDRQKFWEFLFGLAQEAQKEQKRKEAEEERQRIEAEKQEARLAKAANKQINKDLAPFEIRCEQIGREVSSYYNTYNLSVLDNNEYQFNELKSDFENYCNTNRELFSRIDGETKNRVLQLNSQLSSVEYAINQAKIYLPEKFTYYEFTLIKSGKGYYLSIPDSFTSSTLVIPSSLEWNRNRFSVLGIHNISLSKFTNLTTIKYDGDIVKFDVRLHNSAPNLTAVYLNNRVPPSTPDNYESCRNYTVFVPDGSIEKYCTNIWSNSIVAEKNGSYFTQKV